MLGFFIQRSRSASVPQVAKKVKFWRQFMTFTTTFEDARLPGHHVHSEEKKTWRITCLSQTFLVRVFFVFTTCVQYSRREEKKFPSLRTDWKLKNISCFRSATFSSTQLVFHRICRLCWATVARDLFSAQGSIKSEKMCSPARISRSRVDRSTKYILRQFRIVMVYSMCRDSPLTGQETWISLRHFVQTHKRNVFFTLEQKRHKGLYTQIYCQVQQVCAAQVGAALALSGYFYPDVCKSKKLEKTPRRMTKLLSVKKRWWH